MRSYGVTVRRALDRARRLAASLAQTGRWPLTLGIAAALVVAALGPASAARADPYVPFDPREPPDARLDFVVKSIHIRDDRDLFGSGEMRFHALLCHEAGSGSCTSRTIRMDYDFSASTGDTVVLDREVPQEGDGLYPTGFAVVARERYFFKAYMYDSDPNYAEDMGGVYASVNAENGWRIGTYTVRSLHEYGSPGDYDLTFEIRRKPLPDLHVRGVRSFASDGRQFYCAVIENIGQRRSELATLSVRTPGVLLRGPVLPELEPNQTTEHCVLRSELPAEQHQLSFEIDEPLQIWEMDEKNNRYELAIPAVAPASAAPGAAAPAPEIKPSGTQAEPSGTRADLAVLTIRINGQAPDGRDDCKDGKNDVTVLVKNAGTGDAGSFTVRLAVDGDDVDAAVAGLDTGQEREVRFDDVRLKQGERTLRAVADAEQAIAESKEENNDLKITARCKDAG